MVQKFSLTFSFHMWVPKTGGEKNITWTKNFSGCKPSRTCIQNFEYFHNVLNEFFDESQKTDLKIRNFRHVNHNPSTHGNLLRTLSLVILNHWEGIQMSSLKSTFCQFFACQSKIQTPLWKLRNFTAVETNMVVDIKMQLSKYYLYKRWSISQSHRIRLPRRSTLLNYNILRKMHRKAIQIKIYLPHNFWYFELNNQKLSIEKDVSVKLNTHVTC